MLHVSSPVPVWSPETFEATSVLRSFCWNQAPVEEKGMPICGMRSVNASVATHTYLTEVGALGIVYSAK